MEKRSTSIWIKRLVIGAVILLAVCVLFGWIVKDTWTKNVSIEAHVAPQYDAGNLLVDVEDVRQVISTKSSVVESFTFWPRVLGTPKGVLHVSLLKINSDLRKDWDLEISALKDFP